MSPESKDAGGTRSDAIKTSAYALSVNGGSTTNLTFDLNGNMTSDGTNAYAWDAKNRMIKITYPGTNNFSTFVYDGLSRNVSIVETTAGSITSTKQFVWASSDDLMRQYAPCEARNAGGTITAEYFSLGAIISGANYSITTDHLGLNAANVISLTPSNLSAVYHLVFNPLAHSGSTREMTNSSGVIQAQYAYDPYGRRSIISETVPSDFGYAGYYPHSRSALNLTRTRSYSSTQGRFISRDPVQETGGDNLFAYVMNKPIKLQDPLGLYAVIVPPTGSGAKYCECVSACGSVAGQYPGIPNFMSLCIAQCMGYFDPGVNNGIGTPVLPQRIPPSLPTPWPPPGAPPPGEAQPMEPSPLRGLPPSYVYPQ